MVLKRLFVCFNFQSDCKLSFDSFLHLFYSFIEFSPLVVALKRSRLHEIRAAPTASCKQFPLCFSLDAKINAADSVLQSAGNLGLSVNNQWGGRVEIPYETHTCTNTRTHKCQIFPHIFIQTEEEKTQKEEQPSLSQLSLHHFIIISWNGWSPQVRASTA